MEMEADFRELDSGIANVLLLGAAEQCAAFVEAAVPRLAEPVVWWRAPERLVLPQHELVGTLVLHGVDTLDGMDQRRLLEWLERQTPPRVIATADPGLVIKVERGAFLDSLYYRLNIVCIEVDAAPGAPPDRLG
jgi:hypothetical protein